MRAAAIVLVTVAAAVASVAAAAEPAAVPSPAEQSNVAPGAQAPLVPEHDPFSARVAVRNPYDRAVRVKLIDSDCACDRLEIGTRFLLPKQETWLDFRTANANTSGERSHRIWLHLSDPELETIVVRIRWRVLASVSVDLLPEQGPFDRRPENPLHRDIYQFTEHRRPDELHRLRKVILLSSPEETRPEGGLRVDAVEYEGRIWRFDTRPVEGGVLLIARGPEAADAAVPEGRYEEAVQVRTNHPQKPLVTLRFNTAVDAKAGTPEGGDPWSHLR